MQIPDHGGRDDESEIAGRWQTQAGNTIYLRARRGTGYASLWLDQQGQPRRIGKVRRAGARIRSIEWGGLHRAQTDEWKAAQRTSAERALAAWSRPPTATASV